MISVREDFPRLLAAPSPNRPMKPLRANQMRLQRDAGGKRALGIDGFGSEHANGGIERGSEEEKGLKKAGVAIENGMGLDRGHDGLRYLDDGVQKKREGLGIDGETLLGARDLGGSALEFVDSAAPVLSRSQQMPPIHVVRRREVAMDAERSRPVLGSLGWKRRNGETERMQSG